MHWVNYRKGELEFTEQFPTKDEAEQFVKEQSEAEDFELVKLLDGNKAHK